jgi:hypothetical protein
MRAIILSPLLLLAAVQCTSTGPETLTGDWGGQHVGMVVTSAGAELEYDCAHGRITEPLRPDREGEFRAAGVHVREHGGPVREGEQVVELPARYFGRIRGERMTLRVELTADGTTLGTFELARGASPNVLKCL